MMGLRASHSTGLQPQTPAMARGGQRPARAARGGAGGFVLRVARWRDWIRGTSRKPAVLEAAHGQAV